MGAVLNARPLLLRACEAGAFGSTQRQGDSSIHDALFTFLDGPAAPELLDARAEKLPGHHLVCLTDSWAQLLAQRGLSTYTRWHMQPMTHYAPIELPPLPEGYAVQPFDERAFAAQPFGHGQWYRGWEEFERIGAGAVVVHQGEFVASASSFLSHGGEVELDISTDPAHRRRGLALHCADAMLRDCARRGIAVHWDAQNVPSRDMALRLGFKIECEYTVFMWKSIKK